MAKRTYTDEEKAEALTHYQEHGPTQTAVALGIPKQTIHQWALQAGVRTVYKENQAAAVQAARVKWEARRIELAHGMGLVAEHALVVANEWLNDSPQKAKDAALTMAIMVDKAQLLTGAATSRPEHTKGATIEDEIRRLAAELDLPNPVNKVETEARLGNQVDA